MPFTGSCHCGAIHYTVDEDPPTKGMECNCSMCRRRGAIHHFTTPINFTLHGSRDGIATYEWHNHVIGYRHCQTCGCAPFAEGTTPDGKAMVEINLRCADIDLDTLDIVQYDGASR